ncbi:MAG TPA: ferritin-like protein [Thermoanaerobaculia bacterium]|jgi:hypothetical protein|nr:ferritin-like protein [Thermoanaerobaculia bacterium]
MAIQIQINGVTATEGFLLAPLDGNEFPAVLSVVSSDGTTGMVQLRVSTIGVTVQLSTTEVEIGGTIATILATSRSKRRGDIILQAEVGGLVAGQLILTAIGNPRVRFAGRFESRFATNSDFYNEPRGTPKGWTWALEGEPDFVPEQNNVPTQPGMAVGRVVRFHDPVALRTHVPPVGVFVTAIEGDIEGDIAVFTSGDSIIGEKVSLGPNTYFASNRPANPADPPPFEVWDDGEEPLEAFELHLGSRFSGGSQKLTDRPQSSGFASLTGSEIQEYGIIPLQVFAEQRRKTLLADYTALSDDDRKNTAMGRNLAKRIGHLGGAPELNIPRLKSTLTAGYSGKEIYTGIVNDAVTINADDSAVLAFFEQFSEFALRAKFFNFHSDELCGRVDGTLAVRTVEQVTRAVLDPADEVALPSLNAVAQPARSMKIIELMQMPTHDMAWIREAVQAAIELELSTIPPYLCALWSIDESGTEAEELIRRIVQDEMGHMGLMCNLLKGLGEPPKIVTVAPRYPGPLPGGVRPELIVYLSGLNRDFLHDVLMEIEKPEEPLALLALDEAFPSIGKFYQALSDALVSEQPTLSTTGQLKKTSIGVDLLANIDDAVKAIDHIKGQGEGTTTSAIFDGELAHYYKFGEIYHGRKLVESPPGTFNFTGAEVPFPKTLPMAKAPAGGWPNRDPDGKGTLKAFNDLYASVLQKLESAWAAGGAADLSKAVGLMLQMADPARELMKVPRETCDGNYGPDFIV